MRAPLPTPNRLQRALNWARRPNVWIPGCFFGMFAVIIAANGIMVAVGLETWPGLATKQPFESSVVYNQDLAERDDVVPGPDWDLAMRVDTPGQRVAEVTVALTGAGGAPLIADKVQAGFVRPTHDGYDRIRTLQGQGDGTYTGAVALPLEGLWELRVNAEKDGQSMQRKTRFTVQQ